MKVIKVYLHGKDVAAIPLTTGQEYSFGRGNQLSFQMQDLPGISRQHFIVKEENGHWVANIVSKFGEFQTASGGVSRLELENGCVFKVSNYEFKVSSADNTAQVLEPSIPGSMAAGDELQLPALVSTQNSPMTLAPQQQRAPTPLELFKGNEDATSVVPSATGRPSLRIVKQDGVEQKVDLEGHVWVAGRESTCDVFLPDRKASRKQFEIHANQNGFQIVDLGSANGTLLNGAALIPDQHSPIKSGDQITVNSLKIYFEVRDDQFEKKLVSIPPDMFAPPVNVPVPKFEIINYPANLDRGGALKISDPENMREVKEAPQRNPLRLFLILVILVAGLYAAFGDQANKGAGDSVKQGPKAGTEGNDAKDAFKKLTPAQQQMIKEYYTTVKTLDMQAKYELAAGQIQKIHDLLPDGYLDTKNLELRYRAQQENERNLAMIEAEQRRVAEQNRLINDTIKKCNSLADRTSNLGDIKSCLAKIIEIDPENRLAGDLISRVQRRAEEKLNALVKQKDFQERVAQGRQLYDRALSVQKNGDWFAAIDAFKKHIDSAFPDPNSLKAESEKNITSIKEMLETKTEQALGAAQSAYQQKNYKDAIDLARSAKQYSPKNEKIFEIINKARRDLNAQLRPIYEDAVVYESVGQVSQALKKWKLILEKDSVDGDYYTKSKLKLRNYSDISGGAE